MMKEINERIEWLEKAIKYLRNYRKLGDFSKISETEMIINIAEYDIELKQLKQIKKENASLFR